MAEFSAGSIAVFFKAQTAEFVKGVEDVNKTLDTFKSGVQALGAFEAFRKISESVMGCVEASSEAELNIRKLQAVVSSQQDVGKFQELAEQLSHVTTFSDDASMSALALLGKFNLTDQQMASMLPKIQDMAAAMGTDLSGAAEMAGRAIANGAGGLRGLGLAFTQAEKQAFDYATQSERVAMLTEKMAGKFDGLAVAAAETGAGSMKQFHNATEELQETLGRLVDSPVADFFGNMTGLVNNVTSAIEGMSEGTRTAIAVVGGMVASLTTYALGAIAVSKALAFFGGLPAILSTVASAFTGLASTIATVVLPITVVASTILMIEGMVSRIKSGNFNSGEGLIEGIKNNFKQGLDDLKSGMGELFSAPKTEAASMTESMKGFDTTLNSARSKLVGLDFGKELADIAGSKEDVFDKLGSGIGLDFSKNDAVNVDGKPLAGIEAIDSAQIDARNAAAITRATTSGESSVGFAGGMNASAIAARAAELKGSVSGVDMAIAGFKGGIQQLASKFGATGTALAGVASKLATGDPVGAAVSLGIEMLSRTKSFGKVMQGVEKIFTALSQILEPLVAALVPFLDTINSLVPVVVALEPVLKILGYVVKKLGEGLKWVVDTIIGTWNGMLEGLASLAEDLPFIGDDLASSIRDAKIKVAEDVTKPLADPIPDLGKAADNAKKALDNLTESTTNVPQGFRLEAARYNSINPNDIAKAATTPGQGGVGMSFAQIVRQGHPEISGNTVKTPPPGGVTIQTLNVTSNDPDAILRAAKEAARQQMFLATGRTTSSADSARQYWGK